MRCESKMAKVAKLYFGPKRGNTKQAKPGDGRRRGQAPRQGSRRGCWGRAGACSGPVCTVLGGDLLGETDWGNAWGGAAGGDQAVSDNGWITE